MSQWFCLLIFAACLVVKTPINSQMMVMWLPPQQVVSVHWKRWTISFVTGHICIEPLQKWGFKCDGAHQKEGLYSCGLSYIAENIQKIMKKTISIFCPTSIVKFECLGSILINKVSFWSWEKVLIHQVKISKLTSSSKSPFLMCCITYYHARWMMLLYQWCLSCLFVCN